jgi:hypothetical protein
MAHKIKADDGRERECLSCFFNEVITDFYRRNGNPDGSPGDQIDYEELSSVLCEVVARAIVGATSTEDRPEAFSEFGKMLSIEINEISEELDADGHGQSSYTH